MTVNYPLPISYSLPLLHTATIQYNHMHVCGNVSSYYYGGKGGSYEEDDRKNRADTVFLTNERQWEQRQIRITERLSESGVIILCRHSVIGLYFEDNRVLGALLFDGKREVSIKADITIDATSDGHLIRMTDVKKRYGYSNDGSFVPFGVTLRFTRKNEFCSIGNDAGITDHYSKDDFSKKVITAHANASYLLENEEILSCALNTGIREGLTYEGEDSILYDQVLLNKQPEKVLFWAYSDFDRHGEIRSTDEELFQNWYVIANLSTVLIKIPVPMGSIVPKNIKGLVTAGRCLSCDSYTQSAIRMNRDMFRMGECIGIATAIAVHDGVDFLDIDYQKFLSIVKQKGCFDGNSYGRFGFDISYRKYLAKMKSLGRTPDKKYEQLAPNDSIYEPINFDVQSNFNKLKTDAPGVAIWSCYLCSEDKTVSEKLYSEMCSTDDTLYKNNCAITLGLLGDKRALPIIRDIIENRDCFFFTDNRRSNQFRTAVATCLLGRLGNKDDLKLLMELLSENEINRSMYHTLKADYLYHVDPDRNFVYFAIFTHACMAVYNIYKRLNLSMEELHKMYIDLYRDGLIINRITDAKKGEIPYEEVNEFIKYLLRETGSNVE